INYDGDNYKAEKGVKEKLLEMTFEEVMEIVKKETPTRKAKSSVKSASKAAPKKKSPLKTVRTAKAVKKSPVKKSATKK
ncbi:MAG: hypothetical protein RSB93_03350, partial [Rikenellaceae bacterium]